MNVEQMIFQITSKELNIQAFCKNWIVQSSKFQQLKLLEPHPENVSKLVYYST